MLRKYEVEKQYINSGDEDYYTHNATHQKGIASIKQLEEALSEWLDDFSKLDLSWRVGEPL